VHPITHEKLRFIRIKASVRHSEDTAIVEFERRTNLVCERLTPDRLAAFTSASWVTGLYHEAFDIPKDS